MINGLDKALSMLTTKFTRIENAVSSEVSDTGHNIQRDAANLSAGTGIFDKDGVWIALNGKVKGEVVGSDNGYRIWVDAGKLGAYIEFGTGEYAKDTLEDYNKEWRDLAYDFFVNGKGKLPARPYMYPSWVKNTTGLKDRLKKRMNKPY
jgi:hypothetical protein